MLSGVIEITVITLVCSLFQGKTIYYPDSVRYETGIRQHYPFNLRLIRINFPFVLFIPLLTYFWLLPYTEQALFGGLLVLGLSGIFRQNIIGYRLVDGLAICLGLLSSICFQYDLLIPAFIFLILASLTKETMPVFISLWSMSFVPLAGLIVPVIVYFLNPPLTKDILGSEKYLKEPLSVSGAFHNTFLINPVYFLSWGVCITAVLYQGGYWQWVLASVIIGYSQLLVATDRCRLFMYSFPLVILAVCSVIELNWLLILVHLYNPFHFVESGYKKEGGGIDKSDFKQMISELNGVKH